MLAELIGVIVLGYLIGAIPFGLVIGKVTRGVDVREYGSGKTGAANVMRTVGRAPAGLVTVCDVAKGAGAVFLARWILGFDVIPPYWETMSGCGFMSPDVPIVIGGLNLSIYVAQAMVAMAAIAGHNWSPYIKFQGGRGVATFFGGLVPMCWPVAAICGLGVLMGVTKLTRYVSLGSILAVTTASLAMLGLFFAGYQPVESLSYTLAATALILFQHRDNIRRLRAGTERKVGEQQ